MQVSVGVGSRLVAVASAALVLLSAGCKPTPEGALAHGRSQDPKTRTRGIQELVDLGAAGVPGLVALLREPAAAKEAHQALIRVGRPAVPGLLATLQDPAQSLEARTECINLVGELKAAEAIGPLIRLLPDAHLGDSARWALAAIGPAAIDPLAAALADAGTADEARVRAAGVLAAIQGPRALEALLAAMGGQAAGAIRSEVLRGLAKFDDPRASQAVVTALTDGSPEVRKAAFELLAKKPDPKALEPLLALLEADEWRASAAKALGQLRDPKGFERMGELLAREGDPGRKDLLPGLVLANDPGAISPATRALRVWELAPDAGEVLTRLGWKPATPDDQTLVDLARRDKAALLARWDQVRPLLLADLQSKAAEPRVNAARWLILLGKDEAVPPLVSALEASNDLLLAYTLESSGKPPLVKAARAWAARRKVELLERRDLPPVVWNRPPPID